MGKRIATGILFAILAVFCIFLSRFTVLLGVGVLIYLALGEFYRLVNLNRNLRIEGYGISAAALLFSQAMSHQGSLFFFVLLFWLVFLSTHFLAGGEDKAESYRQIGLLILAFSYITAPMCFSVYLRGLSSGAWWLFLAVAATASCDTGAYFVGKLFGKNKLAPSVSPGKTVEGSIGGLLFSMAAVVLVGRYVGLTMTLRITLGAVLAMAAMGGDLFESYLKRKAGVKDSGTLLAGHGGVLDRIDSHLFTLPVLSLYIFFSTGK